MKLLLLSLLWVGSSLACTASEPTHNEAQEAIKLAVSSAFYGASSVGAAVPGSVQTVEVNECHREGDTSATCDAVVNIRLADGQVRSTRASFFLTKKSGEWVAEEPSFHGKFR